MLSFHKHVLNTSSVESSVGRDIPNRVHMGESYSRKRDKACENSPKITCCYVVN